MGESEHSHRLVEILSLLGEGGFGRVYRGRVTSDGGFTREVAIKFLRESMTEPQHLERLRDEARTLLMLRDRAIVSCEPPVRLGDAWGVMMEYIDGLSGDEILKALGPLPRSVALEVVGEVARALDAAYRTRGPSGALKVVHRDVKAANIQLTRTGEVKLLDFGAATADYDAREAKSGSFVFGTLPYMAPERFDGECGPESDVFALGITLYELVVGHRPNRTKPAPTAEEDPVLALAAAMYAPDPVDRPSAREVCERCRALGRRTEGPSAHTWSHTLPERKTVMDELVGRQFALSSMLLTEGVPTTQSRWWLAAAGAGGLSVVTGGTLAVLAVLGIVAVWWSGVLSPAATADDDPVAVAPASSAPPRPAAVPVSPEPPTPDDPSVPADPAPAVPAPATASAPPPSAPTAAAPSPVPPASPDPEVAAAPPDPEPAAPAPEPATDAPEPDGVAVVEPPPPPEPVGVAPDLTGTWDGTMRGLPLMMELTAAGGSLSGTARVDLGTQVRSEVVRGSVSPDGAVAFTAGPFAFDGVLQAGGSLAGTYRRGTAKKAMDWSASRR